MLTNLPGARLSATIVWIPILKLDDAKAADRSAAYVHDERARQLWDGTRASSVAIGKSVGLPPDVAAWDIYLTYAPGARWDDGPPAPSAVFAQVGSTTGTVVVARKGSALPRIEAALTEKIGAFADPVGRPDDLTGFLRDAIEDAARQDAARQDAARQIPAQ